MTAQEARKIVEENEISIENILDEIKVRAEDGYRCTIHSKLSINRVEKLISLGYSVREFTDPFNGIVNTIIEW